MSASHAAAVAVYAHDIAKELGLTEEMQQLALLCGLVHDIGKHNVVSDLIDKPTKLTPAEFNLIKQHSEIGERLLQYVAEVVRHHHERISGKGYPDGKSDQDIPLLAKIVTVADSYNAMTAERPYKEALTPETAIHRLREEAGIQFDRQAVEAFIAVLAVQSDSYKTGSRVDNDFDNILQKFADW